MNLENIKEFEWVSGSEKPEGYTSFQTMSKYVDILVEGDSDCRLGRYCHDRKTWFITFPAYSTRSEVSFWRHRPNIINHLIYKKW